MSENSSNDTSASSGGSPSAPPSSPSAPSEHWLPRSAAILTAGVLVFPTALSLPKLYEKCGESAWLPTLMIVAVGAPQAVAGLVKLIQAFRGGSK